jgi:hypothetical protein
MKTKSKCRSATPKAIPSLVFRTTQFIKDKRSEVREKLEHIQRFKTEDYSNSSFNRTDCELSEKRGFMNTSLDIFGAEESGGPVKHHKRTISLKESLDFHNKVIKPAKEGVEKEAAKDNMVRHIQEIKYRRTKQFILKEVFQQEGEEFKEKELGLLKHNIEQFNQGLDFAISTLKKEQIEKMVRQQSSIPQPPIRLSLKYTMKKKAEKVQQMIAIVRNTFAIHVPTQKERLQEKRDLNKASVTIRSEASRIPSKSFQFQGEEPTSRHEGAEQSTVKTRFNFHTPLHSRKNDKYLACGDPSIDQLSMTPQTGTFPTAPRPGSANRPLASRSPSGPSPVLAPCSLNRSLLAGKPTGFSRKKEDQVLINSLKSKISKLMFRKYAKGTDMV